MKSNCFIEVLKCMMCMYTLSGYVWRACITDFPPAVLFVHTVLSCQKKKKKKSFLLCALIVFVNVGSHLCFDNTTAQIFWLRRVKCPTLLCIQSGQTL